MEIITLAIAGLILLIARCLCVMSAQTDEQMDAEEREARQSGMAR